MTRLTPVDSEISEDEGDAEPESLSERIAALQDMIPPTTRRRVTSTFSTVSSYVRSGLWLGGKGAWVVSTSALLFGIPFALCIVDEQGQMEAEKEEQARRLGNELLAPGATNQPAPGQAKPAL